MSEITAPRKARVDRDVLGERFQRVRETTRRLCDPLTPEDMVVQIETFTSPAKWHLAHTTWFFETFILEAHEPDFSPYDPRFRVLFNSYYHTIGDRHPRPRRGLLTRPGAGEVFAYRDTVDERLLHLLQTCSDEALIEIAPLLELGVQHEQQHQELLLTDVKLLLSANPTTPAYRDPPPLAADSPLTGQEERNPGPIRWLEIEGGVVEIGVSLAKGAMPASEGRGGFAFDNECPRHRRFLEPFALADRLVTNAEYQAFIDDGGYERPTLWLDEGWHAVEAGGWRQPLYWRGGQDGAWLEYTLDGLQPLHPHRPVCHVSFFEADAFARWAGGGARLPTEAEWEHIAEAAPITGNFLESGSLHPRCAPLDVAGAGGGGGGGAGQLFGDVWEWTRSAHEPYPGYAPPPGAVGEYNGKFMSGSFILRGGSCLTSAEHIRPTYRNFFEPAARWQMAGIRLAREIR